MPADVQRRPRWAPKWWLVPLLVAVCVATVGFFAVRLLSPAMGAHDSGDSELIRQSFFRDRIHGAKEVRAQIGEERFWRSIRRDIGERPADWEARFRDWLRSGGGNWSPKASAIMDKLLPRLENDWIKRDDRLRTTLMIIEENLKETAVPALPELISLAGSNRYEYASSGVRGLRMLQERASPALPALFRRLEHVRHLGPEIVETINAIDPKGSQSIFQFIDLLQRTTDQNRAAILPVIGRSARLQPELATNLWPALEHTNRDMVLAAIRGLMVSRQLTPVRLESFRDGFSSTDARARWLSLNLVSASWPDAGQFVPELREAASRKSPDQSTALVALRGLLSAEFLPLDQRRAAAEALIASDSAADAWDALAQLDRLGNSTAQMLSLVTGALGHPNERIRAKTAEMLGRLGPAARPALPQLRTLRQDEWKMVRDAAEAALPQVGE